jgi:hypothetical protein
MENSDPGTGIHIPDPQHCSKVFFFISIWIRIDVAWGPGSNDNEIKKEKQICELFPPTVLNFFRLALPVLPIVMLS